ncbi:MAG: hypothetical protein NTY02_15790, partial [Acidobacteria bacterium]|nr:hypothetical protein [Acidobacteriota bacterium]
PAAVPAGTTSYSGPMSTVPPPTGSSFTPRPAPGVGGTPAAPSTGADRAGGTGRTGGSGGSRPADVPRPVPAADVRVDREPPAPPPPVQPAPTTAAPATTTSTTPVPAPTPAPPAAPGEAVLRADFEGPAYAVTLFSGDSRLGRIDGAGGGVTVDPGTYRIRAVNETMYLNADLGTVTLRAGERRALSIPGSASAVFSVKGEDYTGVRVVIDGRQVPGPYPAQIARIAAGPHRVVYRWLGGAAAGREIADTITVSAGGHFLVRAVPDNEQIVVQQLR